MIFLLLDLLLPLALDTFVLGAALGLSGLDRRDTLRVSLILAAFEATMPVVGFLAGLGVGRLLGSVAGYAGIAFLVVAGLLLLVERDGDERTARRLKLLAKVRGFAIVDLGLSISADELSLGLSVGLLGLPLAVVVPWIALQGFVAGQVGIRLGSKLSEALRESAERLAGVALIVTAAVLLILRFVH